MITTAPPPPPLTLHQTMHATKTLERTKWMKLNGKVNLRASLLHSNC